MFAKKTVLFTAPPKRNFAAELLAFTKMPTPDSESLRNLLGQIPKSELQTVLCSQDPTTGNTALHNMVLEITRFIFQYKFEDDSELLNFRKTVCQSLSALNLLTSLLQDQSQKNNKGKTVHDILDIFSKVAKDQQHQELALFSIRYVLDINKKMRDLIVKVQDIKESLHKLRDDDLPVLLLEMTYEKAVQEFFDNDFDKFVNDNKITVLASEEINKSATDIIDMYAPPANRLKSDLTDISMQPDINFRSKLDASHRTNIPMVFLGFAPIFSENLHNLTSLAYEYFNLNLIVREARSRMMAYNLILIMHRHKEQNPNIAFKVLISCAFAHGPDIIDTYKRILGITETPQSFMLYYPSSIPDSFWKALDMAQNEYEAERTDIESKYGTKRIDYTPKPTPSIKNKNKRLG